MLAKEIMSRDPQVITPDDSLRDAARLMADYDCGSLPVVEDKVGMQVVGVLSDRDIAIRGVARGKTPDSKVNDVMSPAPACAFEDDEVEEVERIMVEKQVRRVPVVDRDERVVGIIAQADLATNDRAASAGEVGRLVKKISEPATPRRTTTRGDSQPEQRL